jgi:hypothetical protein
MAIEGTVPRTRTEDAGSWPAVAVCLMRVTVCLQ